MSEEEVQQATALLRKLSTDELLPYDIFLEFARLSCFSIVELVPLRKNGDDVEVLLFKRPAIDQVWIGMVHTPGVVIRPTDARSGLDGVLKRLIGAELPGTKFRGEPIFVEIILREVKRGTECANVYYVEVDSHYGDGAWHNVSSLPDNVIDTQIEMIRNASKTFADASG